jgi:hypothetical protein
MAHIGIKLADGSFYPILDEDSAARKAMVVTTVKDRQPSVRINLYKAADGTASTGMLYIGSLLIEDLPLQARGGPDIRLELSLDEAGELQVEASEKTSGASQSLSVTLGELEAPADDDGPDFDLGAIGELDDSAAAGTEEPPISLVGEELDSEFPPMDDELDSEFPALDNELPPLDDELAEPETNEAGLGNLDSEFPALDDDLPALDDELAGNGDMADFSLSDADGRGRGQRKFRHAGRFRVRQRSNSRRDRRRRRVRQPERRVRQPERRVQQRRRLRQLHHRLRNAQR